MLRQPLFMDGRRQQIFWMCFSLLLHLIFALRFALSDVLVQFCSHTGPVHALSGSSWTIHALVRTINALLHLWSYQFLMTRHFPSVHFLNTYTLLRALLFLYTSCSLPESENLSKLAPAVTWISLSIKFVVSRRQWKRNPSKPYRGLPQASHRKKTRDLISDADFFASP